MSLLKKRGAAKLNDYQRKQTLEAIEMCQNYIRRRDRERENQISESEGQYERYMVASAMRYATLNRERA